MFNTLCLIGCFKNEGMIIEEWINHYINEGVEHFYLIDNGSTDDYELTIDKYKSKITLIKDDLRLDTHGTQQFLLNKYFKDVIKKYTWVINVDLD